MYQTLAIYIIFDFALFAIGILKVLNCKGNESFATHSDFTITYIVVTQCR